MTLTEAKKRFSGFTRFHNSIVEDKYKCKKAVLWQIYGEDLMNTGCIEISSYESKDNRPHMWS
jgi:hypothetical protein